MGRNQLHSQLLHMENRIRQHSFYQAIQRRLTQCLVLRRLPSLLSWRRSLSWLPGVRLRVHQGINFGVTMLTAPIVTVFTRKFGMQSQMILGAGMLCGGFVSASYTTRGVVVANEAQRSTLPAVE